MKANFLAPYDDKMAVFEKTDDLNKILRELDASLNYFSNEKR